MGLLEEGYWVEFLGVRLSVKIGIHDHELDAPQQVILDVKAMMKDASETSIFDYDALEHFLSNDVPQKSFDYQEELGRYIVEFLRGQANLQRVEVALCKPDAYRSGIVPGIRLAYTVLD